MSGILFSIIIPHKDIPHLLQRCLDSIPQRPDLQVIVVDDSSTPETTDFGNLPGKDRSDIEYVLCKKSGGAGVARNIGLEKAKGKWIIFADADDFFHPCLSEVLDKYKNSSADIIILGADSLYCDTLKPAHRADHLIYYHEVYAKKHDKGLAMLSRRFGEPWAKIISRSLIERQKIRFDEIPCLEDMGFSARCGAYATSVEADPTKIYCVTERPGSLSKKRPPEFQLLYINLLGQKERLYLERGFKTELPSNHYRTLFILLLQRSPYFSKGVAALKTLGFSHMHIYSRIALSAIAELYRYPQRVIRRINRHEGKSM